MAITPKKALGNKPTALQIEASRLEQMINQRLAHEFSGRNTVDVEVKAPDDWVRQEIIRRFENSGWMVGWDLMADGGCVFRFTPMIPIDISEELGRG